MKWAFRTRAAARLMMDKQRIGLSFFFLALILLAISATAVPAQATVWNALVLLDGLQETPPVATPGSGSGTVSFDDVSGAMTVSGSFADLIGTANNAHVHGYAAAGTPAGVVFGLAFTPSTAGTFSGNGIIPAARIADVLNGLTYINLHSTFRPGGEIRGQIVDFSVPEPASLALVGASLAFAVLARRRH